jgi:AcrR family transcriptional regulator
LKASTPRGIDTRNLILDVAEKLFAENDPAAVTVRTSAVAANINTQAVNYHFGSKGRLFEEMFGRRMGPVNRERLERLDACVRRVARPRSRSWSTRSCGRSSTCGWNAWTTSARWW